MTEMIDVLVVGATGFTGRQIARELAGSGLRIGVFGRDRARLEALELDVPQFVGDVTDASAIGPAVARARIVANAAGPFSILGDQVVAACVECGTHYADITGETPWARRLIDRHHERAKRDGTRIVPFAGFDSVPADLACLLLARRTGGRLVDVDATYRLAGGLNGGTFATALHLSEHESPRELVDPFLLAPTNEPSREDRRHHADPRSTTRIGGRRVAPFFMGPINRRVVYRSHALVSAHPPPDETGRPRPLEHYGERFRYREWQDFGGPVATRLAAGAFALGGLALTTRPGRAIGRRLGPRPGEGPSEHVRTTGYSHADFTATAADGEFHKVVMRAQGDPGNVVTTRLLAAVVHGLADAPTEMGLGSPGTGGVLTPAVAVGERLLTQLRSAGGVEIGNEVRGPEKQTD